MPDGDIQWQNFAQEASRKSDKGGSGGGSSDSGSRYKKPLQSAGKATQDWARTESENAGRIGESIQPVRFKRGGKVRKTGPAVLHRGERVVPRGKVKRVDKVMKRHKMRMKASGR